MPIANYGVLKGTAIDAKREDGQRTPHYQVHILAGNVHYRLAVNVESQESPSDLLFIVDDNFEHPITVGLPDLPTGFKALPSESGGVALDYIRANLFNRRDMRTLPPSRPGPDNDLADQLDHFIQRAINEPGALVFAFGQRFGPENKKDSSFGFLPGNGVHDIHMNQGNDGRFTRDDGVWQDGGLILQFPSTRQWVGIFLAFQSQAFHTDDQTGHTSSEIPQPGPAPQPDPSEPDHTIRIIGALVNPVGPAPEHETVTILNASPDEIDLTGWQITDKAKNKAPLSGSISAGATSVIALPPNVQLGNKGGLITVLDKRGLKVDGVSYTQAQAAAEGWTIVF